MSCLYYFNARWYDPQLGRFITEDPIKNGNNWFAYAANNPLRFVDPSGLREIEGTELTDDAVYDAWDTGTIVTEPETVEKAEALNDFVAFWTNYEESEFDFTIEDFEKINDSISTASGLLNANPEVLQALGLSAANIKKILTGAGRLSQITGWTSAIINGVQAGTSLQNDDIPAALKNALDSAASVVGVYNPYAGIAYVYLDLTYGTAIRTTAKTAAEINASYNRDPLGFLNSMYQWAGVSLEDMWAPRH